jgi:hypothetical protein
MVDGQSEVRGQRDSMPWRDKSWVTEGALGVDAADGPKGHAVALA